MLECFRPHIHDIEDIIADPATADAKKAAMLVQEQLPEFLNLLMQAQQQQQGAVPTPPPQIDPNNVLDHAMTLQQMEHEKELAQMDQQSQSQNAQQNAAQSMLEHQQQLQQLQAQAQAHPPNPAAA
jgi:hypothetical protein